MTKTELHEGAYVMRMQGTGYSQIKRELGLSKSTLSLWLRDFPLSPDRIRELRDHSEARIEKYRETRRKTRESRWEQVKQRAAEEIGALTPRELLIAGLFLYWGEGGKTKPVTTCVSNTDPAMLRFFLHWLEVLGAERNKVRVHVHLYADMEIDEELSFWAKELGLPLAAFRKPYIKTSVKTGLTYKQRFTHGTCNILYHNRDVSEFVLMALEHLRERFAGPSEV